MIGYEYLSKAGILWRKSQRVLMPLSPPHITPEMNESEAERFLHDTSSLLLRWQEGMDSVESSEWWYVIKDKKEDIGSLSRNTRSKIRRGLKKFDVAECSRQYILDHGYDVYKKSYERYDTFEPMYSENSFREAIAALPDETEFWAVHDKDDDVLVAFSENFVSDDTCFYSTIWLSPQSLKNYSAYVLFHMMNVNYLNERGFRYVSDGARSLSHQTNIHEFLESKFGFRKAYANLRIAYRKDIKWLVLALYPFHKLINQIPLSPFKKLSVLLEQERIRRTCDCHDSEALQ